MVRRVAAVASLTAVIATVPCAAGAQSDPGAGRDALPSLVRVGVPGPAEPGLSVAATGGFALTEAQEGEDGAHHRLAGILAGAVVPVDWLAVALRLDGRYDTHPGGDDGWIGAPAIGARAGGALGALRLGAEAWVTIPGEDFPSLALDAPVVDLRALAALELAPAMLAAHLGYRLDRSAGAIDEPQRLSAGDRLAIGLSDFDALLLGLGAGYELGSVTLLGEATWEVLLGEGAPPAGHSPLRVSAGARYRVAEALALELVVEASPNGREAIAADDPLYPVEPRFGVWLGARWALPFAGPVTPAVSPEEATETPVGTDETEEAGTVEAQTEGGEPPTPPEQTEQLPSGELRGLVRSFTGRALDARITVEPLGEEARTDPDGFFEIDVPPGSYEVVIEAEGYRSQRRGVTVEENGVTILNADLRRDRR